MLAKKINFEKFRLKTLLNSVFLKFCFIYLCLGLSDEDINDALNENFMVMYHEYAPDINKLLLSEISPRVVKFNNEIPVDELFIE